jgi:hypothetical protein
MKKVTVVVFILFSFLAACEKIADEKNNQYSALIVGFDLNCSTCIISFPDDSLKIKDLFGISPGNYYEVVNLYKNDFKIGDKLRVNVRKAENEELKACITLYPSSNYRTLYVSEYERYSNLRNNDTVDLAYKNCLYDPDRLSYICLDSILTDSRCPSDVVCVWAGEAIARFKIEKNTGFPVFMDLKEGVKDTVVFGYKISFLKLLPYPISDHQTKQEEYKARIVIKSN